MNPQPNPKTNPDPITVAPGAHPIGTGIGAVGGGTAGAAIGAAVGPPGALIGAAVGAVVGGLAGKGLAESIDPTVEDAYWRDNYLKESYTNRDLSYDDYSSAYRTGYTGYGRYPGKKWDDVESHLQNDWEQNKGESHLAWPDAKPATKAAWERVERSLPGDADGNGR